MRTLARAVGSKDIGGEPLPTVFRTFDANKVVLRRAEVSMIAGTPGAGLETNHYLLDHGKNNGEQIAHKNGITIIPPAFIHPEATVKTSVIGPYTSIGAGCKVSNAIIAESILADGAQVSNMILKGSLIGQAAVVNGCPSSLNVGDDSLINFDGNCS